MADGPKTSSDAPPAQHGSILCRRDGRQASARANSAAVRRLRAFLDILAEARTFVVAPNVLGILKPIASTVTIHAKGSFRRGWASRFPLGAELAPHRPEKIPSGPGPRARGGLDRRRQGPANAHDCRRSVQLAGDGAQSSGCLRAAALAGRGVKRQCWIAPGARTRSTKVSQKQFIS